MEGSCYSECEFQSSLCNNENTFVSEVSTSNNQLQDKDGKHKLSLWEKERIPKRKRAAQEEEGRDIHVEDSCQVEPCQYQIQALQPMTPNYQNYCSGNVGHDSADTSRDLSQYIADQLYMSSNNMTVSTAFRYMDIPAQATPKKEIKLKGCVLIPPSPTAKAPTLRERPNGCKTVFVGGVPENTTDVIIREVFELFGEVSTIRMSSKNFCHIRFGREEQVEKALFLSGYRLKIDVNDTSHIGRIHVDYAIARDDQHDYKVAQRAAMRIDRHRSQVVLETNELSAFIAPRFSDENLQKLCCTDQFKNAVQVLNLWMNKGNVSKTNSNLFFSKLQSLNCFVTKLLSEKSKFEYKIENSKLVLRKKILDIYMQFNDVEKMLQIAKCPTVWGCFTKAQKMYIELWKKQSSELRQVISNELMDEIELSNGEDTESSKDFQKQVDKARELRERKELLKQVGAASAECYAQVMHKKIHRALTDVIESSKKLFKYERLWATKLGIAGSETIPCSENKSDSSNSRPIVPWVPYRTVSGIRVSERDLRLIILVSMFLNPKTLPIDFICAYLNRVDVTVTVEYVENLLRLFPTLFLETFIDNGGTLVKEWTFIGFNSSS